MTRSALQHRARVEARILDDMTLLRVAEACHLPQAEVGDLAAVMQVMIERREVIALTRDGVAMFRTFQFDAEGGRIFDVAQRILKLRPPHKTDLWLCHWLTRELPISGPRRWRALAMRMTSSLLPLCAKSSPRAMDKPCPAPVQSHRSPDRSFRTF